MKLIDTHTHLYLEQFDQDRDEIVQNAINQGVDKMLLPNIDKDSIEALWSLCDRYPTNFFPMAGLHPTSVKADYQEELNRVAHELETRKYIAVGEIGIDLYWDKTFTKQQEAALLFQFELAIKHDLPVVIHSRDSFDEIMKVMDDFNNPKLQGVFHCFTGSEEDAMRIIDKGFLLGLGGVLTFKNSKLGEQIKNIDLKHIVLETDSPYLTPAPYRGKRNESAYIYYVAKTLAEIHGKSIDTIAKITNQNAQDLFNI
ncbi:MAG: TatD family hydrolase [Bacteroidales bacterium]|nr:TatD family hydrolase [Bacteroidales bacterium]